MNAPPDDLFKTKQANFENCLGALRKSLSAPVTTARDLSGIIKDFELTYELTWKLLKMFLEQQGHTTTTAKNVFAKAYQLGLINNEKLWIDLIGDRNLMVHTYDEASAKVMVERIRMKYFPAFEALSPVLLKEK